MTLKTILHLKSNRKLKTIIFPESYDERIIGAARVILKEKSAKVVLINTGKDLSKHFKDSELLDIIDINFNEQFLNEYFELKRKKKPEITEEQCRKELNDPLIFSCMLLRNGYADGVIAGSVYSTTDVLRASISIVGLAENNKTVSSFFLFHFPKTSPHKDKILAYADSGVIPTPNAEQLSDIAIQTAKNYKKLTSITSKVAFLSFSTKGSAKDESLDKILEAYQLTKKREPKLICDAELQFDAAYVPSVAKRKNPKGAIKGDANVFIFPDLNAGNIAYKITERIGGAIATGPIVQGLAKPVMDLSRGCDVNDIVNMSYVISKF
jgi:phosphate acetyltransferase